MTAADRLRPAPGTDTAGWTRRVFADGDYAGAAMFGDAGTWQYHAAHAMLRGDDASCRALADHADPEARLHLGAARWIHGDTAVARRLLATLDAPQARNLVRLIDQPRIRVLTQLPWLAGATTDLLGGAAHDPAFELRNIGYHRDDAQNHPYAAVGRFVDQGFVPDFYLAAMVEWHHLPPDLQALPCPLFGHVADHDLHAQTLLPWLSLCDELIVTDRSEWLDVQGLGPARVASFPKVFGLPGDLPPPGAGPRHLDCFVSGTMLDPYHPDKAALLHAVLSLPDVDLRVVRGFTGAMAYHALLAASKASFTYVRRGGAMPTRGLEALAMGCAVAVQEESCLRLYAGDDCGTVAWGPRTRSLPAALQTILADWPRYAAAARRGARLVREQFALPRVASQYLRFLTFRAAAPRAERQRHDTRAWCQKRLCVSRTWLPPSPAARRRTMQANFRHLAAVVGVKPTVPALLDMARELLTEFLHYEQRGEATEVERALRDDALRLLGECERLFPQALVPRCVRLRILFHHGDPAARAAALQSARDLVQRGPDGWQIGPDHDVLPFDCHGDLFDYRTYLDLVLRAAKGATVPAAAFARLLLASLAGYVGRATGEPAYHERAAGWNPEFARHRLDWARALLARGDTADRAQALELLRELAGGSVEFAAAARLLHEQEPDLPAPLALARFDEDALDAAVRLPSLFAHERRAPVQARQAAPAGAMPPAPRLAVLVPDADDPRQLAALLTDLAGQTEAAAFELVVAQPPQLAACEPVLASFRGVWHATTTVAVAAAADRITRLEACRRAAKAPLLTAAGAGDRFRPDTLALLLQELHAHPDAGLAYGNDGWTATEVAAFDPSACVALSCWPVFGRRRLRDRNLVGLHAVWRQALHERHGGFDPRLGAAAEHAFWQRATSTCAVRQLRPLLATHRLADHAARSGAHRPPPLPAALFAPALADEAQSHARLGIVDDRTRQEIHQLEEFYGTALLHGDLDTAARMLQAAIDHVPSLVSPRLAMARLLAAIGAPGARAVLAAGLGHEPYGDLLARLLASPAATSPAVPIPGSP
jgi:hypothetical protein